MNAKQQKITKDMIVNEVITKYPQTAEIIAKYGVDMCCGGVQSIEKTATACNVKDLEGLMVALNNVVPEEISATEEQVKEGPPVEQPGGPELKEVTGKTTVKEIIMNYPHTKGVFSKHGLLECGGEYGPEEAIYFFARVHNVDADSLIKDLNDIIQGKSEAPEISADEAASAYENIHEKFIKAAIVIALTTGCVYGAILLFYMGLQQSLYSVSRVLIETHGHTQIFGWCGLFIMGVSYFVLPRFYATRLYSGKLANVSFVFMVIGIFLVFTFRSLLPVLNTPFTNILIVLGCLLEVFAVLIFIFVALMTILSAEKQELENYEGFMISGYLWFLVQTLAFTGITIYMIAAGLNTMPHVLVGPLRHIQIMGFITFVIFGVLSRTLPVFLGLKAPNPKITLVVMLMLNFSVILRAISEPLKAYFLDINFHVFVGLDAMFFFSSCLEFIAVIVFLLNLNLLRKPEIDYSGMEIEKSYEKFVWAAIVWLVVAEISILLFTFYETITTMPVSHALMGSYRHAITVGFITMLIFGYSSRIIPISRGIKLYNYKYLMISFFLLNIGIAMRVFFQPLAVHTGSTSAYLLMGISGFIECIAILLFGINIWKTLNTSQTGPDDEVHDDITRVKATTNVYQLIKQHPKALDILINKGFTQLKNPILRNTLARTVNIAQAAKMKTMDLDQLLVELNEAIGAKKE